MQRGIEFEERDFFRVPFSQGEIIALLQGKEAKEMLNAKSPEVKKRGLRLEQLSEEEIISLMIEEPRLIKRPIVTIAGNTHFGADVKTLSSLLP